MASEASGRFQPELFQPLPPNPADCLVLYGSPLNTFGLAGMWIQSVISGCLQDVFEQDCTNSLPGIFYPGQSPEGHAPVNAPQGQMDPETMWICNAVIDPVGKGCTQLFNPQAVCANVDDDTFRDLAIRNPKIHPEDPMSQEAQVTQGILSVTSFTEDLLDDACASEVALLGIGAGQLVSGNFSGRCNHDVALIACVHDNLDLGEKGAPDEGRHPRASLFVSGYRPEAIGLPEEDLANCTSNANVFGGVLCTAAPSGDIAPATPVREAPPRHGAATVVARAAAPCPPLLPRVAARGVAGPPLRRLVTTCHDQVHVR
ncbi:unnamed protein product [Prorocentrum cordatum]|uniref:Uncharacterized protein n=1 Tax=Prorocentrum cordatum TaxID=2364126 RepID=A0ABN9TKN9_9DINO|nr:unnamed protein product [Polarella glacialis]